MAHRRGKAELRIGTSGWHYKHWVGTFYPARTAASKMLDLYCESFDTVELNNTFYRLPPEAGVVNWREATPPNFMFAAKGSRFLTHMKKLKDPELGLKRYFERVDLLGKKLGPIVFQLPPHWTVNLDRFELFLDALPGGYRYAFEFRNTTWDVPDIYSLMKKHNVGYCIFHLAGTQSPIVTTADFTYIRLHGPGGKYQGTYSDAALGTWAHRIKEWQRSMKAVYVYFDNDDSGYAPNDALRLKAMLA